MARKVDFGKFKIIECTALDCQDWGGLGICDNCGDNPMTGYYVAVLNRWMCKKCFEEWKGYAVWYREDAEIEERNYSCYSKLLGL